jgi:hypothetical protein
MTVYLCAKCEYLRCAVVDTGHVPRNDGGCHKFDGRDAAWHEVTDPAFAAALRFPVSPGGAGMNRAPCPRCGSVGVHLGETPLPDGNGAYEQYRCRLCGHGFMLRAKGAV